MKEFALSPSQMLSVPKTNKKKTQKSRDHLPAVTQAQKNRKDGDQDQVSPPGLRDILHVNSEHRYSEGPPTTPEPFVVFVSLPLC